MHLLRGRILITGGSGTLGQTIIRRAQAEGWPCTFTIYSRSELLQAQMRAHYPDCRYILGDVRDYDRLSAAIAGHDTVIHAAAMKRLPECEANPTECYATNVAGSANVLRACMASGVERLIGISTDKACRAITCYGASKRMMEAIYQAAPHYPTTVTLVRYGNVIASRGSVIPIWREQAAMDQPLTVTDRRCTRFWMTPNEAVTLVLRALSLPAGQMLIARMPSLGIVDMARVICPGATFRETGLRSLEKLHEDLVHTDEPVEDAGDVFVVNSRGGKAGQSYTSDTAPKLTADEFAAMLAEVERGEGGLSIPSKTDATLQHPQSEVERV